MTGIVERLLVAPQSVAAISFSDGIRLWLLLAVGLLLVLYVVLQRRRQKYALRFTDFELLDQVAPKSPGWRRHLPATLQILGLSAAVVALAGPQRDQQVSRERATIMVTVDVSFSMNATDVTPSRLEAAQQAALEFLDDVPETFNVGVVAFGGSARVLVNPTIDRDLARTAITNLEYIPSTKLGEAIGASLDAIRTVPVTGEEGVPAVVLLLSDGESTDVPGLTDEEGIAAAQEAGVPVSTIAFGTASGIADVPDGEGGIEQVPVPVVTQSLEAIADGTGGRFFTAETTDELSDVYGSLASSLGSETERRSIANGFIAVGLLLGFAAAAASLRWFNRLP